MIRVFRITAPIEVYITRTNGGKHNGLGFKGWNRLNYVH